VTTGVGTAHEGMPVQGEDRYRALPQSRYDLIIIGGGTGRRAGRVALLDRERLGGECLYSGCVPSKALLHVAHVAAHIRAANALGLAAQLAPIDLSRVEKYDQRAIRTIHDESGNPDHYARMGVDVAFGEVRFLSGDSVAVNGRRVSAKRFLIATGSHPSMPPIPGLAEAGYLTNETVFSLRTLPARVAVIGGGPVGCELGQAFARLGSQVTLLQRAERVLPRDELEAADVLQERFEAEAVTVFGPRKGAITGASVE
jgi:pyruvate/2-oxoglutarate dehydrogenase complex dihydrolipoamide dehydrogenase (E3) component